MIWYELVCDDCARTVLGGSLDAVPTPRRVTRFVARKLCWTRKGGKDLCPCCNGAHRNGPMGFCEHCHQPVPEVGGEDAT